jgi:hypothetical protein
LHGTETPTILRLGLLSLFFGETRITNPIDMGSGLQIPTS